jgi:hypothetical protein
METRYTLPMKDVLDFLHKIGVPAGSREVSLHIDVDTMEVIVDGYLRDEKGQPYGIGGTGHPYEQHVRWTDGKVLKSSIPPEPASYHEEYKIRLLRSYCYDGKNHDESTLAKSI